MGKTTLLGLVFILISIFGARAQQRTEQAELPFKEIPAYPENYESGNVMARFIDGLGYRYFWATEGLTTSDLAYRPSPDSRSILETMQHIDDLIQLTLNAVEGKSNIRGEKRWKDWSFTTTRNATLTSLNSIRMGVANQSGDTLAAMEIRFNNNGQESSVAAWHLMNGPIADALYHVGQLVNMRRANGNPMNPKVDVFRGKTAN
ncbi:hypothetical protein [Croceiramulus getboli]|nr:hypothetical protein P8624_11365 [Flavobacteriaceae bacterium YJPT1-3]